MIGMMRPLARTVGSMAVQPCRAISASSVIERIGAVRRQFLAQRMWGEKEVMDLYLQKALEANRKYAYSVSLTPEERVQYEKIKAWYKAGYVPQDSTLIPFHPVQAVGRTAKHKTSPHLSRDEVLSYLHNGFVGPLPIRSLSSAHLQAILEKFPNFNDNYYRNLGSLYGALSHRCLLDLATNRDILAKVSSILGDNIQLSNMTIHEIGAKTGKSSKETGGAVAAFNCHSDLSSGSHYYFKPGMNQLEGLALDNRGVCVWVSITGTTEENAPLYLFPKTHLWEITTPFTHIERAKHDPSSLDRIFQFLAFQHKNPARRMGLCAMEYEYLLSSSYRSIMSEIRRTEVYVPPGYVILFNQHLRHGSGFNASNAPRLAVSLRYNTALKEVGGTEEAGAIVSRTERERLGLNNNSRKPMIQLLGTEHHPNNVQIDLERLRNEAN